MMYTQTCPKTCMLRYPMVAEMQIVQRMTMSKVECPVRPELCFASRDDRSSRQIMDGRKEHLHVATATRWNSELRSIESFLALREETLNDLTESVPALAAKVVAEAGRKGLQELVKVI
ncbi:hypothetical protein FJT64_021704 [Amphibalanus amphitrite]|uniref:Uncharacterized protein n=1 Tax=Amphibalanus amphitrite TaxID=1232801 RepID=A0A6A4WWT3_AMPAM|nr:hypothetical protein FJT64_021704 [Amphibalanus amphitrite]